MWDLQEKGLYRGKADNKMSLPQCSRSKDIIEPMLKPQWWVDCQDMAAHACAAVREKRLEVLPSEFESVWFRCAPVCFSLCLCSMQDRTHVAYVRSCGWLGGARVLGLGALSSASPSASVACECPSAWLRCAQRHPCATWHHASLLEVLLCVVPICLSRKLADERAGLLMHCSKCKAASITRSFQLEVDGDCHI